MQKSLRGGTLVMTPLQRLLNGQYVLALLPKGNFSRLVAVGASVIAAKRKFKTI